MSKQIEIFELRVTKFLAIACVVFATVFCVVSLLGGAVTAAAFEFLLAPVGLWHWHYAQRRIRQLKKLM